MIAQGESTPTLQDSATKTRLKRCWQNMRGRCTYKCKHNFNNYGGRGIVVCDAWNCSFLTFATWALANGYANNLTLDRINGNGNYEPANCRWVTLKQQSANVGKSRFPKSSIYKGVTKVTNKDGTIKWRAQIRQSGRQFTLGTFDTQEEAAKQYDAYAVRFFGRFARLNFPAAAKDGAA